LGCRGGHNGTINPALTPRKAGTWEKWRDKVFEPTGPLFDARYRAHCALYSGLTRGLHPTSVAGIGSRAPDIGPVTLATQLRTVLRGLRGRRAAGAWRALRTAVTCARSGLRGFGLGASGWGLTIRGGSGSGATYSGRGTLSRGRDTLEGGIVVRPE